jgi:hypothetical protein
MSYKANYDGIKWDEERPVYEHKEMRRPGYFIISDTMEGTVNPADGKTYDSKTKYHATLKAHGLEICDDPIKERRQEVPGGLAQDIKRAYDETMR